MIESPGPCEICLKHEWNCIYEGKVRDGVFGSYVDSARIWRCCGCEVERLDEHVCIPDSFYETEEYRQKLQQQINTKKFFEIHDDLQIHNLRIVRPLSVFRNSVLADIGCGGGSFLDHIRGMVGRAVAVEPCSLFHESLRHRGCEVYSYAEDVSNSIQESNGILDLAVSFQVIEHVSNPLKFLQGLKGVDKT